MACAMLLIAAGPAHAADLAYSFGYGLDYSSNIARVPNDPQEEWTHVASANLTLQENRREVQARVGVGAEYRIYENETFPDEGIGALNLAASWHILPERFSWVVEDVYTQTLIDPLAPASPANRQDTNIFSTGPDFTFRLSAVQSLELGARHMRSNFEESDLDNQRRSAYGRWRYRFSPRTSVALNYAAESTQYEDNGQEPDVDRHDGFLQLAREHGRNEIVVAFGRTWIREENQPELEGDIERFAWTHHLDDRSSATISYSSELTDVAREILTRGLAFPDVPPSEPVTQLTREVFTARRIEAAYVHRRAHGNDSLRVYRQTDDYEVSLTEEERRGVAAEFSYDFSAALTGSIFGTKESTENRTVVPAVNYDDASIGVRLLHRLSRTISLALQVARYQRESDDSSINNYSEDRAILSLVYTSAAIRRPVGGN